MPERTYREKCTAMSELMNETFLRWQLKRGRPVSQAEFAKHIGIPATTLSPIITGQRLPRGANIHKLAAVAGPGIYDILEEPRRVPQDPIINQLLDHYYRAPEEVKQAVIKLLDESLEENETEDNKVNAV